MHEIERFLDIRQIYTAGLKKQGKLFAIVHIFKRKSAEIENIELVHQLLNQFSVVLQNKLYQIELEQKEKALQQALNETKSSYIIWNSQTNKLDFSKKFIDELGFMPIELESDIKQWEKLVHPDDKIATLKKINRFFKERISFQTEYRIKTKDNNYKWFEATFKINKTNHLNDNEVLIVHTDIDQSKKAEIALLNSRNRFQKLANVTSEGIIIHKDGVCIDVNNALLEITGLTKNDLIGKEFAPVILCDVKNQTKLFETTYNGPHILYAANKNGYAYYIEVSNRSLDDKHEVFTIRNVSELKEKEIELQKKNNKLNEAIQLKNKFIKILSHDLKNPFSSINGIIDLLDRNLENYAIEKSKNLIQSVAEEGKNAYNLLESLLLWSHKNDTNLELQIETIDLKKEVDELMIQYQAPVSRKNITMVNNTIPNTLVKADIQLLKSILRNLIGNAIKYTPKKNSILIDCNILENTIQINVKNEGDRIHNEIISKILSNNFLSSEEGTESEKGSGFGLSIVKDIIGLHGSKLSIKSTDQFNIFSFCLESAK
ncbi:MAG: hypothetical protein C0599_09685 [Salinivirgaceae bacterium]|nr:MAG: hypothetical protein C0599_09685 [Salinivirgaceae bacterium]